MSDTNEQMPEPFDLARRAAEFIAKETGVEHHDVALVLGSGWAQAADLLGDTVAEVPAAKVPGFSAPAVTGHVPVIRSIVIAEGGATALGPPVGSDADYRGAMGTEGGATALGPPVGSDADYRGATSIAGGTHALVLGSRTHLYEGRGTRAVAHPIRTAAATGAQQLVLTNGCGGLNAEWSPGQVVLIRDHINLTGATPLEGATFVDLTDLYSTRLRDLARDVDPDLPEGVYVQFRGPQYETPAEVRMARTLGGDLVGMSTTLEAIAAREADMEVLGLSLMTNLAAGISSRPLSHAEVLEAGRDASARISQLLADIVRRMVLPSR